MNTDSLIDKLNAERLKTNGIEPYAVVREKAFLDAIDIIRQHPAAPDVVREAVRREALMDDFNCVMSNKECGRLADAAIAAMGDVSAVHHDESLDSSGSCVLEASPASGITSEISVVDDLALSAGYVDVQEHVSFGLYRECVRAYEAKRKPVSVSLNDCAMLVSKALDHYQDLGIGPRHTEAARAVLEFVGVAHVD